MTDFFLLARFDLRGAAAAWLGPSPREGGDAAESGSVGLQDVSGEAGGSGSGVGSTIGRVASAGSSSWSGGEAGELKGGGRLSVEVMTSVSRQRGAARSDYREPDAACCWPCQGAMPCSIHVPGGRSRLEERHRDPCSRRARRKRSSSSAAHGSFDRRQSRLVFCHRLGGSRLCGAVIIVLDN